jgi:hypothetical protein
MTASYRSLALVAGLLCAAKAGWALPPDIIANDDDKVRTEGQRDRLLSAVKASHPDLKKFQEFAVCAEYHGDHTSSTIDAKGIKWTCRYSDCSDNPKPYHGPCNYISDRYSFILPSSSMADQGFLPVKLPNGYWSVLDVRENERMVEQESPEDRLRRIKVWDWVVADAVSRTKPVADKLQSEEDAARAAAVAAARQRKVDEELKAIAGQIPKS